MRRGRIMGRSRRRTDGVSTCGIRVNRSATLVVVDRDGNPLGAFGPIVASIHVQETADLTEQAAAAGLHLTILRVLRAPVPGPSGVLHCVYVAEALRPIAP